MAATPRFKVYTDGGEYVAACRYADDAAAIVGARGITGYTIRDGHRRIVWTEGVDGAAGDSYDNTADIIYFRVDRLAKIAAAAR